jgi:type II secretory pathway component PulC
VVRNLFKTTRGGVREASDREEVKIEEMPLASLKLKLMGTVVTSDPAMRTAIIAEANGRNERMYREGESINGVTIKKILRFAVVLNTGQRDEVLKMETPEKKGQEGNQGKSSELSIKRTPS